LVATAIPAVSDHVLEEAMAHVVLSNHGRSEHGRVGAASWSTAVLIEMLLVLFAYHAYKAARLLVIGDEATARAHGFTVLRFEEWLHLEFEHGLQQLVLHSAPATEFFSLFYVLMFIPFISIAGSALFFYQRPIYTRTRRTLLLSGAVGLVIFAAFPVAPPRLLPNAGFIDTIRIHVPSASYDSSSVANQYAAIPSFHFAWTAVMAGALWRSVSHRAFRSVVASIPPLMFVAIIVTGNHLWVDALIGLVIVLLAYRMSGELDRAWPIAAMRWGGVEDGRRPDGAHRTQRHTSSTRDYRT
jgi:hypothetical protein